MIVLYIKAFFTLAGLILTGIGFFHVVAAEGWGNGFIFLAVAFILLVVAATPVLLVSDVFKALTRKK
jgi:hypothetical protein